MLFIDKDRHAIAYPLYTYFDDLEREPFYDSIWFEVPFEKELPEAYVFVKRLTKNSYVFCQAEKRNFLGFSLLGRSRPCNPLFHTPGLSRL